MSADPAARPITPVILSGGAGTRLWPLSRKGRPKQMLALATPRSLLATTAARVADQRRFAPLVVVAGIDQADAIAQELEAAGSRLGRLVAEPEGRNTAAAIALAALTGPADALLLVMPSDHLIGDEASFLDAVAAAAPLADSGWLVTFGIAPTRAETGFGYIRVGKAIGPGAFEAASFVEKPDAATAAQYVAEGAYHWNAGIFLMRADRYLEALEQHASDIAQSARAALDHAQMDGVRIAPDAARFAAVRSEPVDRAVMERAGNVAVVPVSMNWSDIGSWQALYEAAAKDGEGNALAGETVAIDSEDCLFWSDGPMIAAIGVQDIAVVATRDAVLIVPRSESQRVQELVAELRRRNSKLT